VSIFGRITSGDEIAAAVLDTLRTWEPDYLAELARLKGLEPGKLPRIAQWATVGDRELAPDPVFPSVLVYARGSASKLEKDGNGTYSGWFAAAFVVDVEITSRDQARANQVAQWYCAALRTALIHNSDLGGFAKGLEWGSEDYDELERASSEDGYARAAAGASFLVLVPDLVTAGAGPTVPSEDPVDDPPGDWPIAQLVDVRLTPEE
jgi:hypothetical protein